MRTFFNRIGTGGATVVVGVATLLTLHGSAGVSAQSEPQTPVALYACANPAGMPRFVAPTEACRPTETRFSLRALGPSGSAGPIPDMLGEWTGNLSGCFFDEVINPVCTGPDALDNPVCQPWCGEIPETSTLRVTRQVGGSFAAVWLDYRYSDPRHHQMTGVVSSDGTVSIQSFNPSEQRFFFFGTVTFAEGTYRLDLHGQSFDDFGLSPFDNEPSPCGPDITPFCPLWFSNLWNTSAGHQSGFMGTLHARYVKKAS